MQETLVKEFAKEHAMSCMQVRKFDAEWTEAVEGIRAAGVDLRKILIVPKKGGR